MADLTTRHARPEDFDFCWQLYTDSIGGTLAPLMAEGWDQHKEKTRFNMVWSPTTSRIVTIDGSPIGWYDTHYGTDNLVIDHFHVLDGAQNDRAAKIILDVLAGEAREAGKCVVTEVLDRSALRHLFESAGFSHEGERPRTLIFRRNQDGAP